MAEKIKVGILGLGRAGRGMHMSEIAQHSDLFEVVAGCDKDPKQIEESKKVCPNARYYADMNELFADPEVEVVTIATRSLDHVDHAIAAFNAGKKVFCEKSHFIVNTKLFYLYALVGEKFYKLIPVSE